MHVRVFRPAKSAMQSGRAKARHWVIEPQNATLQSPEPIMGWSRAGDPFSGLKGRLRFSSKEAAVAFAKNKRWDVIVQEPADRVIYPKNYQDNFRIVRPQDQERIGR